VETVHPVELKKKSIGPSSRCVSFESLGTQE
jgi:hypothetical protein